MGSDRSYDLTDRNSPGRPRSGQRDIDIGPFDGPLPVSRGASERALRRVDRYDRRAEVTAYETLTPTGTVRMAFRVTDDQPFEFLPGYFVGISADVPDVGVRRSPYCIVSPPSQDRTFELLIRLVPEGPLSYYLGSLGLGDVIAFRGPSGRSMVPAEEYDEMVVLATGVGVGPIVSLVSYLASEGRDQPIVLYWGLRLEEDICFLDEVEALKKRYPGFRYQITLSQPPAHWRGLRGRVTESVPRLLEILDKRQFVLVGNGAMIAEISRVLSDLGVNQKFIHEEVYFNVRYRPDPTTVAEIRRRFVLSDPLSPYAHQKAGGLLVPEHPLGQRRDRVATSLEMLEDD